MPTQKRIIATLLLMLCCIGTQARFRHKHKARGIASYYSNKYEGRKTANGDVFTNRGYTAASNKFRLGAYARVTNRSNGSHVYVRINDRMGNDKRLIDLTVAATEKLGFKQQGTTRVKVKVVKARKGKRHIRRQG
jgi:rare lipoprotein A